MGDELGTVEAGKRADLLVVKGDPTADLAVLQNVRLVMHNGVIIRQEME
jgi:imidazolonepropionase-like amidohydrolase